VSPNRLFELLERDPKVGEVLAAVRDAGPDGAYVAAGFVRNRYWDSLYPAQSSYPDLDIDVVYFEKAAVAPERDYAFEAALAAIMPGEVWQVRNQARMHEFGGYAPFASLEEALEHWAETATTVGVRAGAAGTLEYVAPFGLADLYGQILRITPAMKANNPDGFGNRLVDKAWLARWPDLTVTRT